MPTPTPAHPTVRQTEAQAEPTVPAASTPTRLCVIDLGTNSFHGVIVDVHPNGTFVVLDRMKEMVRLGQGGFAQHRLVDDAMERGIQALTRLRLLAEGWKVEEYLAYATSAIREADNGGDFILQARKRAGVHIRPISGELEAELIYRGVRRAIDLPRPALVMDVGGGSSEFIVHDGREAVYQTSLKIGAARMTELFVSTDPLDRAEFRKLRAYYRSVLHPVFEIARAEGVEEVIGSSGTMQNLAAVCAELQDTNGRSIFEQTLEAGVFRKATSHVMRSTRAEREVMAGIDAKRVPQVVAGAVLADVVVKDLDVRQLRISSHALREGIVEHYAAQNYKRIERMAPYASVRRRSVYELAYRFRWQEGHARQVAKLALQLFDACRPVHGRGETDRELLEYAALLHDVGYTISHSKHHKHSRYLIRHADLRGFTSEEIETLAQVARYHRKALPKEDHHSFQKLGEDHRRQIVELASLLRLAEGLDRSHYQNVRHIHADIDDGYLRLQLETVSDPELELWGARRASDLFEQTFGRSLVVSAIEIDEKVASKIPARPTPQTSTPNT